MLNKIMKSNAPMFIKPLLTTLNDRYELCDINEYQFMVTPYRITAIRKDYLVETDHFEEEMATK